MKSADTMRGISYGVEYSTEGMESAEKIMAVIENAAQAGETETIVSCETFGYGSLVPLEILRGYGYKYEWIEEDKIVVMW